MDEVDFVDGPAWVAGVGFVLDGGVDEGALGWGEGTADASQGEVGSEGSVVGVEAEGAAVGFDGGLELGKGGEVAVESNP